MYKQEINNKDTHIHINQEQFVIINIKNNLHKKIYTELWSCCSLVWINKTNNIVFITHNRAIKCIEWHINELEKELEKLGLNFNDFSLEIFWWNSSDFLPVSFQEIGKKVRENLNLILKQKWITKIINHPNNESWFSVLYLDPDTKKPFEIQKENKLIWIKWA